MGNASATLILLFLSVSSLMAFENIEEDKDNIRSVTTSIEINATPEQVWKNVISFPRLKEPAEFIFKTGIAYPINATIRGQTLVLLDIATFLQEVLLNRSKFGTSRTF